MKDCVYKKLFDELVDIYQQEKNYEGVYKALAALAKVYLDKIKLIKKNQNFNKMTQTKIIHELLNEYFFEKTPKIMEVFEEEVDHYNILMKKRLEVYSNQCKKLEAEDIVSRASKTTKENKEKSEKSEFIQVYIFEDLDDIVFI